MEDIKKTARERGKKMGLTYAGALLPAEAHQLMHENKHLGKIAILVGAPEEGQGKTEDGPGAIRAEVGA